MKWNIKNLWRKLNRYPYFTDLKIIHLKYRKLYKHYFKGSCGLALQGLNRAYDNGHFKSQQT